jgi:hypothetical protein
MKAVNDLGLIILLSIGVICVIYWVKQVPADERSEADKVRACVQAVEADVAGSPPSKQDPDAWKKSIEAACKNSE